MAPDTRLAAFAVLDEDEKRTIRDLAGPAIAIAAGGAIGVEEQAAAALYVLHAGWAASVMPLSDGRCQIVKVHLAGDLMGVPDLPYERPVEQLTALTAVEVGRIPREALGVLFAAHPRIAALMFLAAQQEQVFLMERLASIGRTEAPARVAALLLHLHERLSAQLGATSRRIDVPLSQQQLGDVLGLSEVHVNRVLQQMAREGLIRRDKRQFEILKPAALHALSGLPKRVLRRDHGWLPAGGVGSDAATPVTDGDRADNGT